MFSSNAASVIIDPRMGPMQGVQPNPKAIPTSKGNAKLLLYLLVKILISLFINLKLIIPIICSEKNIIIIPPATLKKLELFRKKLPRNDAAEPKLINTREKPKVKKTVLTTTKLFFFLMRFSKDVPEM